MHIGSMNKRISFLTAEESQDEVGNTILTPVVFATVWANISPVSGRDYVEAKKYQAELTYKITVRYLKGITPDMKIQFNDRIFLIHDIINPLEHNQSLEIMAIEKVVKNG